MRYLAVGLVLAFAVGIGNGSPPQEKGKGVVKATGTLEPEEAVDVGAQVAGTVLRFGTDAQKKPITWGSVVKKGDLLAQLDSSAQEVALKGARTDLARAEAELRLVKAKAVLAERELARTEKKGEAADTAVARAALDVVLASVVVAETGVAQARVAVERAELQLRDTTIESPVDGVVIDRRVNVGQLVVASLNAPSLFLIATDLKRLQVWANVDEADIARVAKGAKATFKVDTFPRETFVGKVSQIRLNATLGQDKVLPGTSVPPVKVTYTVVIEVDNPDLKLLPYMTANVTIESDRP
jgi:HlyD family secretion protein